MSAIPSARTIAPLVLLALVCGICSGEQQEPRPAAGGAVRWRLSPAKRSVPDQPHCMAKALLSCRAVSGS